MRRINETEQADGRFETWLLFFSLLENPRWILCTIRVKTATVSEPASYPQAGHSGSPVFPTALQSPNPLFFQTKQGFCTEIRKLVTKQKEFLYPSIYDVLARCQARPPAAQALQPSLL
jgi:hypothetical protein